MDGFIMTKHDFLQKFQLSILNDSLHQYQHHATLKPAAVLIALIEENKQLSVVLTKRASHLKHHPGQISFPGGKMEDFDAGFVSAAIREAEEEIGLNIDNINIVGQLLPYETISGYVVTPIIAFIDKKQHYVIDENEVAEIFHVPLQHFLNISNYYTVTIERHRKPFSIHFMPFEHHNIWGATAVMLKDLAIQLS
ncbi:MAG: 8-oxo-dGTP pyrophosphatase MutT (NUDIX family) [Colwellia sp.]|jgi:8-oxo-dGTP pyrophosphatase MutT (NUDIX family)